MNTPILLVTKLGLRSSCEGGARRGPKGYRGDALR